MFALRVLPGLVERYDILAVEREEILPLVAGELSLMSRGDAILRYRETADILIGSWKTLGREWSGKLDEESRIDDQGISELAALETRLMSERGSWRERTLKLQSTLAEFLRTADLNPKASGVDDLEYLRTELEALEQQWFDYRSMPTRVAGVKMVYLLKGDRKEEPKDSGRYEQRMPLLRGWKKEIVDGVTHAISWQYAWSWFYTCSGPHDFRYVRGGVCPGGARHSLGKDWLPFTAWNDPDVGGVKGWMEKLASGTVQPECGDPLDQQVVVPLPYHRNQRDVDDWIAQARTQEAQTSDCSNRANQAIQDGDRVGLRVELNAAFSQTRRACLWPTRCPS